MAQNAKQLEGLQPGKAQSAELPKKVEQSDERPLLKAVQNVEPPKKVEQSDERPPLKEAAQNVNVDDKQRLISLFSNYQVFTCLINDVSKFEF